MKISISKAKAIRTDVGASQIVIFTIYADGEQHVATHGLTVKDAREAAALGNKLKKAMGWPPDLCRSQPLARVCKNCHFYKPDYGIHCINGWSGDGSSGFCKYEPRTTPVSADQGCGHFEPS